ncbi:MAG: Tex family protein [Anaerovoracaceae bacterium]
MDITSVITEELSLKRWQSEAVIRLIDEGCTIPFIARYRKEAHGAMTDEALRTFDERLRYLRTLEERKNVISSSIREQGKMTEELEKKIEEAETASALEDLYRPYKPKRRTRAMIAREKGLVGLADYLLSKKASVPVEQEAEHYLTGVMETTEEEKEKGIKKGAPDVESAIRMAQDIIAGDLSENADYRSWIREKTLREGRLVSSEKPAKEGQDPASRRTYEQYFDYSEPVSRVPGHRVLAINRGEKEGVLSVRIEAPEEKILRYLERKLHVDRHPVNGEYLRAAAADAYRRLLAPSIETEVRGSLTDQAEDGALSIFRSNLRQLLMQPPIAGKTVLGWDPAFRTGCKLAVCDATGKILKTAVIYPTAPHNKVREAKAALLKLYQSYHYELIAVGNGTASRESEQVIADFLRETKVPVKYVIVNEAGASVYSASKLATKEYPDLDVGERSAASIARRLQDPLAELVKIDPRSIGVGQYQHDMNQKRLGEALSGVVEDCVNGVGVDLNTASPSLLGYVSGISSAVAKNIVKYREENGRFQSRRELLNVAKLGPKAFEQCAGFLRIRGGSEPLDQTAVHPESYKAAKDLLSVLGYREEDLTSAGLRGIRRKAGSAADLKALGEKTGLGEYTLRDILEELEKPGRDPRENIRGPVLRSDVLSLNDLKPGMILKGTVRNIVDFGAFVDIGVHQDGLVHISEMSDRFVRHPLDVVKVGDIVDVRVLSVDPERKKISLSMKKDRS